MAADKGKGAGRGRGAGKGKGKGENGDGDDQPQGPGEHEDDSVKRIHEDYVRRHLGGGAPVTPEAYERAVEQFNRLPGAIRVPPTRVTPPRPSPKEDDNASKGHRDESEEPPS